ncbi:MAG: hypothetical protein FWD31_02735 [Planctomycetaceae bacterium]|nr:hypothetical protein [Planctomycetaceae bacterium]
MAKKIITQSLAAVLRRSRVQRLLESLCGGVFYGTLAALPLLLMQVAGIFPGVQAWPILLTCLLFGLVASALLGWFWPLETKGAAEKADRHYRLKDRLLTAFHLLAKQEQSVIERLQISDAAGYAAKVDARSVVPYRVPRYFSRTVTVLLLAVGLCAASPLINPQQTLEAALLPVPEVMNSIELLKEELVDWVEEKANEHPDEKELKDLSEELDKQHAKLEDMFADPREAIAVMSEMEAAANAMMSEYNLEAMDASLQEIADALSASELSRSASQALKDGNYAKAAEELKNMNLADMSKLERNAIAQQLKQAAGNMQKRNQKELSQMTDKLSDELQEGNSEGACESACQIAGVCEKQGLRKGICQALGSKLALLSLCKSDCAGACQGQSDKNGGKNSNKSNSPSNNWGTGTAGQPDSGEETNLGGNREMKQVTGIQGSGPSEYETILSNEGSDEQTNRTYSEAYREFRKMSESVLETEPIPLGQRRMIRQYFESIRPQGDDNKSL